MEEDKLQRCHEKSLISLRVGSANNPVYSLSPVCKICDLSLWIPKNV